MIAEKFWLSEIVLVVIMTKRYIAVKQKQISVVRMYFWTWDHSYLISRVTRNRSRDPSRGGL